ncbi:MAG: hypothetical protein JW801_12820 [Bacteroidales bacterium]|nr:hypothetical protein [Bacteroidales bacterium]
MAHRPRNTCFIPFNRWRGIVAAAKNLIAQELGRIIILVEMYKKIGKNVEANLQVAYDVETGKEIAKKVIREQLEEQTDILQDKLDNILNPTCTPCFGT